MLFWVRKTNFSDVFSSGQGRVFFCGGDLSNCNSFPLYLLSSGRAPLPAAPLPQTLFKNRLSCMKKHHNVILVLSAHLPSRHLQKTVDESSISPGPTEVANFLLRHPRSGLARQYPNGTISPDQSCSLGKVPTPLPLPFIGPVLFSRGKYSNRSILRTPGNLWGYYGSFGR